MSQGRLETEALAGSAPRGQGASADAALGSALLHSDKDMREQGHVLDSIQRRLVALGLEVEILATVDRSVLPVRILEYREP